MYYLDEAKQGFHLHQSKLIATAEELRERESQGQKKARRIN